MSICVALNTTAPLPTECHRARQLSGRKLPIAGQRVVVGEGQAREAGVARQAHDVGRRQRAVGGGGVAVEVDVL